MATLRRNASMMQLREATIYGSAIDIDLNLIVAATDFGHILVYSLDGDTSKSKVFHSKWNPFLSLHFKTVSGEKYLIWLV